MIHRSVTAKLLGAMAAMTALVLAMAVVGRIGDAGFQAATAAITVAAAIAIGFFLYCSVARPLSRLSRRLDDLAGGKTDEPLPYAANGDEFGRIARAASVFRDAMQGRAALESEA